MINILIGIFIMSAVSTLGMAIEDKTGKDIRIITSGPIIWIMAIFYGATFYITRFIKQSKTKALIKCPDGEIRHCNHHKVDKLRELEGYNFPKFHEVGYPANLWDEKYQGSSGGNIRYTPKRVWKHFKPVDRKIMKSLE